MRTPKNSSLPGAAGATMMRGVSHVYWIWRQIASQQASPVFTLALCQRVLQKRGSLARAAAASNISPGCNPIFFFRDKFISLGFPSRWLEQRSDLSKSKSNSVVFDLLSAGPPGEHSSCEVAQVLAPQSAVQPAGMQASFCCGDVASRAASVLRAAPGSVSL